VIGRWTFDYAIIPHKGDWREACQHAYAFEAPLRAIPTAIHPGELTAEGAFITHTPAEFVISAVKEAENGKGWLVRGYNTTPENTQLNLKPLRRFERAAQVNLAEQDPTPLSVGSDGGVGIQAGGHQIISILFSD
jgi:alpha-mannosidase